MIRENYNAMRGINVKPVSKQFTHKTTDEKKLHIMYEFSDYFT